MKHYLLQSFSLLVAVFTFVLLVRFFRFDAYLVKQETIMYQIGQIVGSLLKVVAMGSLSYLLWQRSRSISARASQ
jgi:hypothetical protein